MQNLPIILSSPVTPASAGATTGVQSTGNTSDEKFDKVLAREMGGRNTDARTDPAHAELCAAKHPSDKPPSEAAAKAPTTEATLLVTADVAPVLPQAPDPAALAMLLPALEPAVKAGAQSSIWPETPALPAMSDAPGRAKANTLQAHDEPGKLDVGANDKPTTGTKLLVAAAIDATHNAEFSAAIRQQAGKEGSAATGLDGPPSLMPAPALAVARRVEGELTTLKALTVEPHVGTSAWGQSLGEKTVWMVNQRVQVADLHLNPPDLGPLQVTVTVNNDQATASFVSQHAEVRQAIESALPKLREMLAESGISLGNTSVDSGAARHQGTFGDEKVTRREHFPASSVAESILAPNGAQRITTGRIGLVDTFA
jgi:flagellar hook-length control protein FliK